MQADEWMPAAAIGDILLPFVKVPPVTMGHIL